MSIHPSKVENNKCQDCDAKDALIVDIKAELAMWQQEATAAKQEANGLRQENQHLREQQKML